MIFDDTDLASRVLVCVVTQLADWERLHRECWYRIPTHHAPRGLAAEYLAFFPTAGCGTERWAIRWIAPVLSLRILLRSELLPNEADHPRAAERYYRCALGIPALLPRPIPAAKLRRVSFIPTTLAALLQAHDLNELWQAQACEASTVWGAGIGRRGMW